MYTELWKRFFRKTLFGRQKKKTNLRSQKRSGCLNLQSYLVMEKAIQQIGIPASDSDSPERSRAKSSAKDLPFGVPENRDDKCKGLLIPSTFACEFWFGGWHTWIERLIRPEVTFDDLASSQQLRADTTHFSSKGCTCFNQNMAHLVNSSGPSGRGLRTPNGRRSQLRMTSHSVPVYSDQSLAVRLPQMDSVQEFLQKAFRTTQPKILKHLQLDLTSASLLRFPSKAGLKTLKVDWNEKSCQHPGDIALHWVKQNFRLKKLVFEWCWIWQTIRASFWCLLIKAVAVLEK